MNTALRFPVSFHRIRLLLLVLLALGPWAARAQGVGVGTTAPDVSAALDIVSSTRGALLPRLALTTAIANPATGLIVFQTGGTPGYYYNAGTPAAPSWQQLATVAGTAVTTSNGLTKTGNNFTLGGTLSQATSVANAGFALNVTGMGTTSFGANVGIGTTIPLVPLSVMPSGIGPKITLWDAGNTTQHYGFGISANQLNYQVQGTADHVFSKGGKNNDGTEMMRLLGTTGSLGIGTAAPSALLDVNGSTRLRGLSTAGLVTTDASGNLTSAATASFGPNFILNQSAPAQTGSFSITGTGTATTLQASGSSAISSPGAYLHWNRTGSDGETWLLNQLGGGNANAGIRFGASDPSNTTTEWARFINNGNLGIGTTAPAYKLDVNGSVRIAGGTPAAGKFLKAVDATGAAVWDFAAGAPGPTGTTGSTGATGPTGTTGATGPQGATGITGAAGVAGPQGATGASGATGVAGPVGAQGPAGPAGATGAQGPQGNQGAQGLAGTNGTNGTSTGDNLGNHTALRNINLAGYLLVGGTASTPGTSGVAVVASGNVGIGTTAPAYPLDVAGVVSSSAGGFRFPDGTTQTTAAGAIVGDIKQGLQSADHAGWVKLDGRSISTLTATQQAQATALSIGANLPDATDKVLKQKNEALLNSNGTNGVFIKQTNLPSLALGGTTSTAGNHTHTFSPLVPDGNSSGNAVPVTGTSRAVAGTVTTNYSGLHNHGVTVYTGGSNAVLNVENTYLNVNQFVYLGL